MTNIEIAKTILKYVGQDSIEVDRALCAGVILLLDGQEEIGPERESVKASTKQPKKVKKFDVGKMKALLRGGWSIAEIADEMKVTEQTVRKHIKQEGLFKDETTGV